MTHGRIAFIGAGNIAQAIIGGLISSGYPAAKICAADPQHSQLAMLPDGIIRHSENLAAVSDAQIVVLCVKPDAVTSIAQGLSGSAGGKLFISVAAGITVQHLTDILGAETAIIRCMPNTPALVAKGMTGLFAGSTVTRAQKVAAEEILGAVGSTNWFVDERALDAVTAVSGSGPAYFFLVMEAMEEAAVSLGLEAADARQLVLQTALGAATIACGSEDPPAALRRRVTSPHGTTEAAINSLLDNDIIGTFERAISAAYRRSVELSGKTES